MPPPLLPSIPRGPVSFDLPPWGLTRSLIEIFNAYIVIADLEAETKAALSDICLSLFNVSLN